MKTKTVKVIIEDDAGDREEEIVFRKLTMGEFQDISENLGNKKDIDMGVDLLIRSIYKAPFAVTEENIKSLDPEVFLTLLDELEDWYGPLLDRLKTRSQTRSYSAAPMRPATLLETTSANESAVSNSSLTGGPPGK